MKRLAVHIEKRNVRFEFLKPTKINLFQEQKYYAGLHEQLKDQQ